MAFDRTEGSERLVTIVNAGRSSFQVHEIFLQHAFKRNCQELRMECVLYFYMLFKALPV